MPMRIDADADTVELIEGETISRDIRATEPHPLFRVRLGQRLDGPEHGFSSKGKDPIAAGMSIADFNGDGRLDIFLPQAGMDQLYMAQSDGTMADESSERLLRLDSASTGRNRLRR